MSRTILVFPVALLGLLVAGAYVTTVMTTKTKVSSNEVLGARTISTVATAPANDGSTTNFGRSGTLAAFSASSITVKNAEGSLTCSIAPSSPSRTGFAIRSNVLMYCTNGALSSLSHQA